MSVENVRIQVWRGTNDAQGWEFKTEAGGVFPLEDNVIFLRVTLRDVVIIDLNTDDDANLTLDTDLGRVTWEPTLDESRLIPNGAITEYELERRIGGVQRPLCGGTLEGIGGSNAD